MSSWGRSALLALLVFGSAMLLGGALRWVVVALAPVGVVLALVVASERNAMRLRALGPGWLLALLAAYSALQAVPMPLSVLARLSPVAADVWSRSLLPTGESPSVGSLSLDPGASLCEALKWAIYAAVFLGTVTLPRRRGVGFVSALVLFTSTSLALVGLIHELLAAHRVFGLYQPLGTTGRFLAPLVNPNNLAGYLVLGAVCGAGLLFSRRPPAPRWIIGAGVVVSIVTVFRTGSRGGVAALSVGLVLATAMLLLARRRRQAGLEGSYVRLVLGTAIGLLSVGAMFVLLEGDAMLLQSLGSDNLQKLQLVRWTLPLLEDYRWFGVGRGAFESVFSAYRPAVEHNVIFTHPENIVAQWVCEWGLPVGGGATAYMAWAFRPQSIDATRTTPMSGAYAGVIALLLQNFVDLGVELPATGIAMVAVLGALWGDRPGTRSSKPHDVRIPFVRWAATGCAALILLFAASTWAAGLTNVAEDRLECKRAVDRSGDGDAAKLAARAAIRVAIRRHPADYYFPLLGASMAVMHRDENPMPWIQRALERGPTVGRTHMVLARALGQRRAVNQAMLELRTAVELDPDLTLPAVFMALAWGTSEDALLRAVPEGSAGVKMLDLMGAELARRRSPLADRIDAVTIERDPGQPSPWERRAALRLDALPTAAPPCDASDCREVILAMADGLAQARPASSRAAQVRARLALAEGELNEAEDLLREACELPEDRPGCLQLLATVLSADGNEESLGPVFEQFTRASCDTRQHCSLAFQWVASVRESRGERGQAVNAWQRACREEPSEACLYSLADAAERAGAYDIAVEALEDLGRGRPADPARQARIAANRQKSLGLHR